MPKIRKAFKIAALRSRILLWKSSKTMKNCEQCQVLFCGQSLIFGELRIGAGYWVKSLDLMIDLMADLDLAEHPSAPEAMELIRALETSDNLDASLCEIGNAVKADKGRAYDLVLGLTLMSLSRAKAYKRLKAFEMSLKGL